METAIYITPKPRDQGLRVLEVGREDFESIVREPNGALLVYLTGYKSLECRHGAGDAILYTLSGYTLHAKSCLERRGVFNSVLPLIQPRGEYFRLRFPRVRDNLRTLGTGRTPLLHDILVYLNGSLHSCKPRIGCEKIEAEIIDSGTRLEHKVFRPFIAFSTFLSHWKTRLLKSVNLRVNNWMCIKTSELSASYVCVEDDGCEIEVDEYGGFEIIRGQMIALRGCSPYLNYSLSLMPKIYGTLHSLEWKRTPFSILCPLFLLNIEVGGGKEAREVYLALWNPLKRLVDCEIYFHEYKVFDPLLYSFVSFRWEAVSIEYNKIRFSVSPNELVFLRMNLKKTLKIF